MTPFYLEVSLNKVLRSAGERTGLGKYINLYFIPDYLRERNECPLFKC